MTIVDVLTASFREALRTPDGMAEPVALLWTDEDGQWRELVPRLRGVMPELHALGIYAPSRRTGPAIWLRCVVEHSVPEAAPPSGRTPILYLPGVGRQELRAAGECRATLQPLIELQYRGRVWHQRNGRDWSVEAFLLAEDGLGLELAQDARTREALRRALPLLAETSVDSLRGRRLEAEDFDRLAVTDPVRDVLRWMSDPNGFRQGQDEARWKSFCDICLSELHLDPDDDAPSAAATDLTKGGGRWDDVWQRFCEAPHLYPGVPQLLREPAAGQGKLVFDEHPRRPTSNEAAESRLRRDLEAVVTRPHREACERVSALETEHGPRRAWVWAQLGESPMAVALAPLARLATLARSPVGGTSIEAVAAAYATDGWRCDRAALEALASTRSPADATVVARVVRALYEPWLDASTRHFQQLVATRTGDLRLLASGPPTPKDTCVLFADGLRFDVAGLLQEKLESRGLRVRLSHRLSPVPTVTATAKPLAMPVPGIVGGAGVPEDFAPYLQGTTQAAVAPKLREEMARRGIAILDADDSRMPAGGEGVGWVEVGRLDELGHKLGVGLAVQIDIEVERIADRVIELLEAGWGRVRIATDHGWLLLPGGLPKVELPAYLIATKWARCAAVRGSSSPAVPTYPWHWNPDVLIASPPGIGSFKAEVEYAHGGVSLQECVVPELVVERPEGTVRASILSLQWRGMRCRVGVKASDPSARVDLRRKWKEAGTSIVASAKEVGLSGEVSLAVTDDVHEGAAATVVVLDADDNVLDRRPTTVGEPS